MFRTVQSIPPPPNSIVPAFNIRRRGALRCSFMPLDRLIQLLVGVFLDSQNMLT